MIDMDDDTREAVIGTALVFGFIMITIIVVIAGCLGGCYIIEAESTKREYIKRGYVEHWNPVRQRMEWIRSDDVGHE